MDGTETVGPRREHASTRTIAAKPIIAASLRSWIVIDKGAVADSGRKLDDGFLTSAFGEYDPAEGPTMAKLSAGDPFPELTVSTVDGRSIILPADLEGSDAILLFYRAWW